MTVHQSPCPGMNVPQSPRDTFLWVVLSYHGTWYTWGGDDPSAFDCSGIVVEGLKSVGKIHRKSDYSAEGLWRQFRKHVRKKWDDPEPGDLCFWFDNQGVAVHVAVCINEEFYIGAEGGGRHVKTLEAAIKENAFIKIRPLSSRPGAKFVHPWL